MRRHLRCICTNSHALTIDDATRAIAKHVRGLHTLNLSICVSVRDWRVIVEIVRANTALRYIALSGLKCEWCAEISNMYVPHRYTYIHMQLS